MANQILEIKNYGKASKLFLCGIDVSTACLEVNYSSHREKTHELNGIISVKIDISNFIEILANVSEEERKNAIDTLNKYFKGYKKPEIPA